MMLYVSISFPRSAWECRLRRSAALPRRSPDRGAVKTAERSRRHSHAGNADEITSRNQTTRPPRKSKHYPHFFGLKGRRDTARGETPGIATTDGLPSLCGLEGRGDAGTVSFRIS